MTPFFRRVSVLLSHMQKTENLFLTKIGWAFTLKIPTSDTQVWTLLKKRRLCRKYVQSLLLKPTRPALPRALPQARRIQQLRKYHSSWYANN